MEHRLCEPDDVSSSAGARHGHDLLFTSAEKDALLAVEDRNTWPLGGDYAHEFDQTYSHHNLAVPPRSTANTPIHDFFSAIPVGHLSVPVRRRRTNGGTTRGIDIGISIGISEHQEFGHDLRWGRGHQHQHYQGAVEGSGIGQQMRNVELKIHHRPAVTDKRKAEEISYSSPVNEPRALGGHGSGVGGGGASATEQQSWHSAELELLGRRKISVQRTNTTSEPTSVGASARDQPSWHSAERELLGRRKISVQRSNTETEPTSVKDTMSWPQARSMSWQLPPPAPLPQLPSSLQPQESGDEGKTERISAPGSHNTFFDGSDAASQDPCWQERTRDAQGMKRACQHPNCRRSPSFSKAGQRAMYCAKHKLDGMINVVSRKCASPGCGKGPSYGHPGDKKPVVCSGHRLPGHVNVVSPRCAQDGCHKGPSFGSIGTGNRATYCAKHKLAGMVNVVSKSCKEEGCNSAPSFGFEGERASFCGKHKRDGQRNLISRRCTGPECSKVPSYGRPGDPRPTFCTHHKPPGAINLLSPRCATPGCVKGPIKESAGQRLRYCRLHSV